MENDSKDPAVLGLLALQLGLIDQEQLADVLIADVPIEQSMAKLDDIDGELFDAIKKVVSQRSAIWPATDLEIESLLADFAPNDDPSVTATGAKDSTFGPPDKKIQRPDSPVRKGSNDRFLEKERLAEGGLGVVFRADDQHVLRSVAIKKLKPQVVDNLELRRRFENEAQITGKLEHPGIIPVYDQGVNADGSPYYAMRLISGDTLNEAIHRAHAAERDKWTQLRSLLRPFVDVCDTMAYAHSRNVIHRDLKPSNIMLGEFGETIVVDWGLARQIGAEHDQDHSENHQARFDTHHTQDGLLIGTPDFMSPEQALGIHSRLDERSDVFSLGATLFVILTGKSPRDQTSGDMSLADMQNYLSSQPILDARRVDATIPKPLAAICSKAMSLNADDRYPSCQAIRDDVLAWLDDMPIAAYQDTILQRASRWTRRNRAWASAGLAALLLVAMVSTASSLLLRQRNATIENQKSELVVANSAAKTSERHAKRVAEYMAKVLSSPHPELDGRSITVASLLDRELESLENRNDSSKLDQKDTVMLARALARAYAGLGLYEDADRASRVELENAAAAYGEESLETVVAKANRAFGLQEMRRNDEAYQILSKVEVRLRSLVEESDPVLLTTRFELLRLKEGYPKHSFDEQNDQLYDDCCEFLGKDHDISLRVANYLAVRSNVLNEPKKGLELNEFVYRTCLQTFGEDHFRTLGAMANYANSLRQNGRAAEALPLNERACAAKREIMGDEHEGTILSIFNLARSYVRCGKLRQAVEQFELLVGLMDKSVIPKDGMFRGIVDAEFGSLYTIQGRHDEAIKLLESAVERLRAIGKHYNETRAGMAKLQMAYLRDGQADKARELAHEWIDCLGDSPLPNETEAAKINLANAHFDCGDYGKTKSTINAILESLEGRIIFKARANSLLGAALMREGDSSEAEPLLLESQATLLKCLEKTRLCDRWRILQNTDFLIELYEQTGDDEKAQQQKVEREQIAERISKAD